MISFALCLGLHHAKPLVRQRGKPLRTLPTSAILTRPPPEGNGVTVPQIPPLEQYRCTGPFSAILQQFRSAPRYIVGLLPSAARPKSVSPTHPLTDPQFLASLPGFDRRCLSWRPAPAPDSSHSRAAGSPSDPNAGAARSPARLPPPRRAPSRPPPHRLVPR